MIIAHVPQDYKEPDMPLRELFATLYQWADAQALALVLGALAWGLGGTLLARIARGGRSDRGGRAIANVVIGGAVLVMVASVLALGLAHMVFNRGMLDANVLLLAAPVLCVVASVAGIHWVFPLSELATVRTLRDVALFAVACAVGLWLLSRFRGWGLVFLGGIADLVVIGTLALGLLRVLYRRAFG